MSNKKRNVTVEVACSKLLDWVTANRSQNTFRMYDGRLKPFRERFGERLVTKLKPRRIEEYFEAVNKWPDGSDKAPDTVRANVTAVEQLQKHLNKRLEIPCVLVRDREKPIGRVRERIPTADEIERIKEIASPAFRLVFDALRRSGARPNELANATIADWKQSEYMIVLTTHKTARKTGRPRKIIVGEKLEAIIRESIGQRTAGPLFLTPQGNAWVTDTLSQTFARYRNELNIDRDLKLYGAGRHAFATACCNAGFNENDIAFLMGHAGSMTQRYMHPDVMQLRDKQDALEL